MGVDPGVDPRAGSDGRSAVRIEQDIDAPPGLVAAYISDFRHAKEWMVGVESVEKLAEDVYRLRLDTPIGHVEPEVKLLEQSLERVRWVYTSTVDGGGTVEVTPGTDGSCVVSYKGDFKLGGRILGRVARAVGSSFARRNGERSLLRLKHLMEARRY